MNRINCYSCGQVFESTNFRILCQQCMQNSNKVFNILREYLYDNPGATAQQVVQETGLPLKMIMEFLKEGRIATVGHIKLIHCEKCGIPIDYGTLCTNCESAEAHQIKGYSKRPNVTSKKTLHIKDKKK